MEARVTALCELGCVRVREVIAALETGEIPAELKDLDQADRAVLLAALKDIMAVYDAR